MQASVTDWLDVSASAHPNNTAVVDADGKAIKYSDLRRAALAIARHIIDSRCATRRPVAVYLPKSANSIMSFLGAAYAGCFYTPIDVEQPESRAQNIVNELSPAMIITDSAYRDIAERIAPDSSMLLIEDAVPQDDDEERVLAAAHAIIDTDLLYVLFTSGSTGKPKGVCISHGSVIDYIDWVTDEFEIDKEDRFANQAPFYFDNSILDIYSSIKMGAAMYIVPHDLFAQPVRLLEWLKENKITAIFWVPSAMSVVARLNAFSCVDLSDTLKRALFCGEVMPNKVLNVWRRHLPRTLFANLYGPTEITDACAFYLVDRHFDDTDPLPIGRAMRNTEILIVDDSGEVVPQSDLERSGELCVRGRSLSRGYWGDRERTDEVFVQDPRNSNYAEKIYRTGDIVRYNEFGELMYVGRKDSQIKHMGHRIELGEIESAVSAMPHVNSCCCVYDGERSRIVLFVEGAVEEGELKERLKGDLPHYMIPGRIVKLDEMPLNANGKIDRPAIRKML